MHTLSRYKTKMSLQEVIISDTVFFPIDHKCRVDLEEDILANKRLTTSKPKSVLCWLISALYSPQQTT